MREYRTPLTVDIARDGNLTDDVVANGSMFPDQFGFSRRTGSGWVDVTYEEFLVEVRSVAKGLLAAGIQAGDRIALISKTRYEWTLVDYAIWFAGAVTVPIYETSSVEQIKWILCDSGARAAVAESEEQLKEICSGPQDFAELSHLWSLEEHALARLRSSGSGVTDEELGRRRTSVSPDSLATLIYTSGTTGPPKGCTLTHGNFMFELGVVVEELHELFERKDASTLLFLPLAHIFARVIQVGAVKARVRLGHTPDIKNLLEDLEVFQPSFIMAVPRVFEKFFNTASQQATADGRGKLFNRAVGTAISYSKALENGRPGLLLRIRHSMYDRLAYSKLRAALGGRCGFAVSGGALLGDRLGHFYRGIGIVVLEGYGLTETTGALTLNLPDISKIGSVGRPLPGTTLRVADDGELLAKGGQVFAEYWKKESAEDEVLTRDGWFHSGDLGEIDDEGFVHVTGRKKEVLVTAGGKTVAPSLLEDRVRAHHLVSQCMVVGDGRPFIAALVTIDPDGFAFWAQQVKETKQIADLTEDPRLRAAVDEAIDQANESVSKAESIRKFAVLGVDWTEEDGQLTSSLKLKRSVVMHEFRADVESLYAR